MSCLLEPLQEPAKVAPRLLGVEVETLGVWRRKDYGPRWYSIGKKIRYAEPDLRAWMKAQAGSGVTGYQRQQGTPAIQPGPHGKRGQDERWRILVLRRRILQRFQAR